MPLARERPGHIFDRPKATAVQRILDGFDGVGVVARPECLPSRLEETVTDRRGHGVRGQEGGEDCCKDELEGLEEGREEALNGAVAGGFGS